MQNPKKEILEYLDKLKKAFLYLSTYQTQLDQIFEWDRNNPREPYLSGQFMEISIYNLQTIIMLETYKLASEKEQISVRELLKHCQTHYSQIEPSVYSREAENQRKVLSKEEYKGIIKKNIEALDAHNETINHLKAIRNKSIAHADKKYFQDSNRLYTDFPLKWKNVIALIECLKSILKEHIVLIKHVDSDLDRIYGTYDAKGILTSLRGFERFWRNKKLLQAGVWFAAFRRDDYDPDIVFMDDINNKP
jgi:hypothetical protein